MVFRTKPQLFISVENVEEIESENVVAIHDLWSDVNQNTIDVLGTVIEDENNVTKKTENSCCSAASVAVVGSIEQEAEEVSREAFVCLSKLSVTVTQSMKVYCWL